MYPEFTLLFKKLTTTLLWIVLNWFQQKLNLRNCLSFVKLKPWGARRPRLYLTRNLRRILMTSTLKDYLKTFLLEVPHGMASQGWRRSSKWAIELNLLLKGKIIISRNTRNAVLKRLISCTCVFCSPLSWTYSTYLKLSCITVRFIYWANVYLESGTRWTKLGPKGTLSWEAYYRDKCNKVLQGALGEKVRVAGRWVSCA